MYAVMTCLFCPQFILAQISYIQNVEESAELRRQIQLMFLDPRLWAAAALLICVMGISLE